MDNTGSQVLANPEIVAKILVYLSTIEDIKTARLINQVFNTEVCRQLRKSIIICLDDIEQVKRYVNFRSSTSTPFELPFTQFCHRVALTEYNFDLYRQLQELCSPKYPTIFYKSWSPILDEECSEFFATLLEHSDLLKKIEFDRCYNVTSQLPPFPPEVQALKLVSFKTFKEECWSSYHLFQYGFEDFVVSLLKLAPSTLEELEFGTPSLLNRVLGCENIGLEKLRKLSLNTDISSPTASPAAETLKFLSEHKVLSQIVDLRLIIWDSEAESGLRLLLSKVSKTLESLALSANFNREVGESKRPTFEFPLKMERLKKLWIDDSEEFGFLTEGNFPILENLRIWGVKFSHNDSRIWGLGPIRSVVKLQISVREEMSVFPNEYNRFLGVFPNLKTLWLCVGHTFLNEDRKLMEFLRVMLLNSGRLMRELEEFRLTMTVFDGRECDGLWEQLVPKEENEMLGFFSKTMFPKIRKVELKQSYFARCSRDPGRIPEIRRFYFG